GLGQFLNTAELIRKGLNRNLAQLGIVLTMFDSRNNLSRQVRTEVKNHFKGGVFETVIPRNVKLSESPSHGKPVILYDISSSGSQSYLNLAREVIDRIEGVETKENLEQANESEMLNRMPMPIELEKGIENGLIGN
ncbi:MAG: ParA family protein, partial [Proteobacteria bacterium]|nr:ParA family protein [Pseudomonadota bacterium]